MHCAMVRCAFKTTLTTMAPIITAPKPRRRRHHSPEAHCESSAGTPVLDQPLQLARTGGVSAGSGASW